MLRHQLMLALSCCFQLILRAAFTLFAMRELLVFLPRYDLLLSAFVLVCVFSGIHIAPANARAWTASVETTFDENDVQKFGYLYSELGRIDRETELKKYDAKWFTVIRVESKEYCRNDLCLTFVVQTCDHDRCPYTSALLGKNFTVYDTLDPELSFAQYIGFKSNDKCGGTVAVGPGFVAMIDLGLNRSTGGGCNGGVKRKRDIR